jgi:hypothetical protein
MEPGHIEFVDEDGSGVPLDRGDDRLDMGPRRRRRGRWPVLALAVAVLAVCGGVLWHQHGGGAKQAASAPATPAMTVTIDPQGGRPLDGGIRPTGQLLAEAHQEEQMQVQRQAQLEFACLRRVQGDLMDMGAAYRKALAAGGSPREAERAARAVLADEPDGGGSGAFYDAVLRDWRINQTALSKLSGERVSLDLSTLCSD